MAGAYPSPVPMPAPVGYVRGAPMMGIVTAANGMQMLVPLQMPISMPPPHTHNMSMAPSLSTPRSLRGSPIPTPQLPLSLSRGPSPGPTVMEREKSNSSMTHAVNGRAPVPAPTRRGTNTSSNSSYSTASRKGSGFADLESGAQLNDGRSPTLTAAGGEIVYTSTWSGAR